MVTNFILNLEMLKANAVSGLQMPKGITSKTVRDTLIQWKLANGWRAAGMKTHEADDGTITIVNKIHMPYPVEVDGIQNKRKKLTLRALGL